MPSAGFNGAGMFPSQKYARNKTDYPVRLASMGPGCFHPRNMQAANAMSANTMLQWGRDVSIPEMTVAVVPMLFPALLQWGRDVSIPEMTL